MDGLEEPHLYKVYPSISHGNEEEQGDDSVQHYHYHGDNSNVKNKLMQLNRITN